MNIQKPSFTARDWLKDNPLFIIAGGAMLGLMLAVVLYAILASAMADRTQREKQYWLEYEREQTRLKQRCEEAGGQYVQYQGDLMCVDLLFNPSTAKEN